MSLEWKTPNLLFLASNHHLLMLRLHFCSRWTSNAHSDFQNTSPTTIKRTCSRPVHRMSAFETYSSYAEIPRIVALAVRRQDHLCACRLFAWSKCGTDAYWSMQATQHGRSRRRRGKQEWQGERTTERIRTSERPCHRHTSARLSVRKLVILDLFFFKCFAFWMRFFFF